MHVCHRLAELGPTLPAVFHQFDMRYAIQHRARGAQHRVAAAFGSPGGEPEFRIGLQLTRDLQRRSGRAHEVLQRPRSAKRADAQCAVVAEDLEQVRRKMKGKKVVLLISGGNIDVNLIGRIIDVGLVRTGRRLRVNALVQDRPGTLARLTDLIARQGANIIQAIHDRSEPSTTIDQTDVALTLETRGVEHSEQVIRALREMAIRVDRID